jgi:hypothetical protein
LHKNKIMKKLTTTLILLFCFLININAQNYDFNWSGYFPSDNGPCIIVEYHDQIFKVSTDESSRWKLKNFSISGNNINGDYLYEDEDGEEYNKNGKFSITLNNDKLGFTGFYDFINSDDETITINFSGTRYKSNLAGKFKRDFEGNVCVSDVNVSLINYSDELDAIPILKKELESCFFLFNDIYSSNLTIIPESPLYIFEPMYLDILPFKDLGMGKNYEFIVHHNAKIILKCDYETVPYSTEIDITIEVRDLDDNLTSGYFQGIILETNKVPSGYFIGSNTFSAENGIAKVKYKTPSAENVGNWKFLKFKATIRGFANEFGEKSITLTDKAIDNIWAEPKHPDHPSFSSKTAIIPASSTFPAQLFALAEDTEGNPIPNEKFTFNIEGNDYGELSNEDGSDTGNEIKVETNNEGIATVFYSFKSGTPSIEPVIQKIKVVEDKTEKSGLLEIKCGLGLTLTGVNEYESSGGIISPDKKIGLVIGVESEFYPDMDLKSYAALAEKNWDGKKLGVKLATRWTNVPDNIDFEERDEIYLGACSFDRFVNPKPDGPKNILYAIEDPSDYVGASHSLPAVIPKTKGTRLYELKASLMDVENDQIVHIPLKIPNKFFGFKVDNLSDNIESFLCAFGATTIYQHYMIELAKKLWSIAQYDKVVELGTILDVFDFLCKYYKGEDTEAALALIKIVGQKIVQHYIDDLGNGGSYIESEIKTIAASKFLNEFAGGFDGWVKQAELLNKEIPDPTKSTLKSDHNEIEEIIVRDYFENIELLLSPSMGAFSHNLLLDKKVAIVFNVSNANSSLNGQAAVEFNDEDYSNLSYLMFAQSENTYACAFEKDEIVQLEFTALDSTLVVVFEGGTFTYYQYPAYNYEGANCSLEVNPENSGVLQIDTNGDNSPDETLSAEKKIIDNETNTGGNTGGGGSTYHARQEWLNVLGSSGSSKKIWDMETDDEGNIYLLGQFDDPPFGVNQTVLNWGEDKNRFPFLAMFNSEGELQWIHPFKIPESGYYSYVRIENFQLYKMNGKVCFIGEARTSAEFNGQIISENSQFKIVSAEVNVSGNLSKIKSYNIVSLSDFRCAAIANEELILTGSTLGDLQVGEKTYELDNNFYLAIIHIKNDAIVFDTVYDFGNNIETEISTMVDREKNSYFCVEFESDITIDQTQYYSDNERKKAIVKITPNGTIEWSKEFIGSEKNPCIMQSDSENNLVLCGITEENSTFNGLPIPSIGDDDAYVIKLGPSGEIININSFGSHNNEYLLDFKIDDSNNYYFAINSKSDSIYGWNQIFEYNKLALAKLDENLNYVWHGELDSRSISTQKIVVINPNKIVMAGEFRETISFENIIYDSEIMFDHDYNFFITSFVPELMTQNTLEKVDEPGLVVFPNPTKNEIFIQINSGILKGSKISIFNINGKLEKKLLTNSELYRYRIDMSDIPNGLHLVKIENEKHSIVKKVIVNR